MSREPQTRAGRAMLNRDTYIDMWGFVAPGLRRVFGQIAQADICSIEHEATRGERDRIKAALHALPYINECGEGVRRDLLGQLDRVLDATAEEGRDGIWAVIDEETLKRVVQHGFTHMMGMCTCPCYDALIEVGNKLKSERELAAKLGSVSPIALASLMGADVSGLSEEAEE